MTLGAYQSPCNIVGAVRLDNEEHIGCDLDIETCRRSSPYDPSECDSSECGSKGSDFESVELANLQIDDDDKVSGVGHPVVAEADNSNKTVPASTVADFMVGPEAATLVGCSSSEQEVCEQVDPDHANVILRSPYNNKAKRQLANEQRRCWSQTYFHLKDAVLSCTEVEV